MKTEREFLNEEDKFLLTCFFLDSVFMEHYDNRDFSILEFSCIKKLMFNIVMKYLDESSCLCDSCKVSALARMRRQIIKSLYHPSSINLISVNTL